MNEDVLQEIESVVEHFDINGEMKTCCLYASGHINSTFLLEFETQCHLVNFQGAVG